VSSNQEKTSLKPSRSYLWISDLRRDFEFSLRALIKRPMLAAIPMLSTAVGIGACSLIFAVANFALFRPLPVASGSTLMSITGGNAKTGEAGNAISYPDFLDISKSQSFLNTAAYFPMMPAALSFNGGEPRRYWGTIASANYFDVVRCGLSLGRGFNPDLDDTPGAPPVVVISHRLWASLFGADPGILNRTIVLNNHRLTVIGVAPPRFVGTEVGLASDFWIPFSLRDLVTPVLPASNLDNFADRDAQWLFGLGRLREGTTTEQGASELEVIAQRLAASYPTTNKDRAFHVELAGQVTPALRSAIVIFFTLLIIIAALVLLTACANVANLLLARGYARHQEIATRLALGAGRSRLIRQLLTESVLLALPGGALGCVIAYAGAHSLRRLRLPIELPVDLAVSLDWRVLSFCAALSVLTGLVFGLAPALKLIRQDLVAGVAGHFGGPVRTCWWSARNILAIVQIAICVVLLTCAGLFSRSLESSRSADTGMAHRDVGLISFDPTLQLTAAERERTAESVLQTVQVIPGIQSAALTTSVPLSLAGVSGSVTSGDKAANGVSGRTTVDMYEVSPGFFDTLGIPFLAGEDFPHGQNQDRVVILNLAAANKLFPGENAIGRLIQTDEKRTARVIGLVATSKSRSIVEEPRPCIYHPLSIGDLHSITGVTLLFRTTGNPVNYLRRISDAIRGVDPGVALFDIRTMEEHLSNALLFQRVMAFLFGVTGVIGLLIAALGLYGVISFLVARQTKEIGIRMALGASRQQILTGVLRKGITLTISGALVGVCVAFLVGRGVATFLYGVTATDPVTFLTVPLLLLALALAACAFPAFRAANGEALDSIRYQ
jgi:predicted permease